MSKYRAVPTVVDGIRFASKKEANRYQELKMLSRAGIIWDFVFRKNLLRYRLVVNDVLISVYEADFRYNSPSGCVVEDTKGFKTPVYRLKKKLMKAIHGIEIQEV